MLSLDLNSATQLMAEEALIFQFACFLLFPKRVFAASMCLRASGPSLLDVPSPHPNLANGKGGAICTSPAVLVGKTPWGMEKRPGLEG